MDHTLAIKEITWGVSKKRILQDVRFTCATGEITGLLGRNGSGKSSLMKVLFGIITPDTATILVDGVPWNAKTAYKEVIAYSPQELMLPRDVTVRNLIPIICSGEEQQNNIFYAPGIHRLEKTKVGLLSTGEQKYLQFLLAVNLPQYFILLDEPFSMVDPAYKEIIKEKILALKQVKGFIITDHYYQDIFDIADKKICISEGVTTAADTLQDLVRLGYLSHKM